MLHTPVVVEKPPGELFITGKAAGETDVAVLAGGKIAGIHVRVSADLLAPVPQAAMTPEVHAASPGIKIEGTGGQANLQAPEHLLHRLDLASKLNLDPLGRLAGSDDRGIKPGGQGARQARE